MKRVAVIVGTRPEAIKLAPLIIELKSRVDIDTIVLSSGQHAEMLSSALKMFSLSADISLNAMLPGQSLGRLGATLLRELSGALDDVGPDLVFVHGDTSTALFGALAAFYAKIPVAHLEAGLRTGNPMEPFPEEFNRKAIAELASYHLAPTDISRRNLESQGVRPEDILVTGNTIVDAVRIVFERFLCDTEWMIDSSREIEDEVSAEIFAGPFALITLHRRENHGTNIVKYLKVVRTLAVENPGFRFVFPVHPNPAVAKESAAILGELKNVSLTQPLDYLTFLHLLHKSAFIISDSGGVQEEAATFGKPLLLCRSQTERPEAITAGLALLVGDDFTLLESESRRLISKAISGTEPQAGFRPNLESNPFGAGFASALAVDFVLGRASQTT